jgi:hypothetical protein
MLLHPPGPWRIEGDRQPRGKLRIALDVHHVVGCQPDCHRLVKETHAGHGGRVLGGLPESLNP